MECLFDKIKLYYVKMLSIDSFLCETADRSDQLLTTENISRLKWSEN